MKKNYQRLLDTNRFIATGGICVYKNDIINSTYEGYFKLSIKSIPDIKKGKE